MPRFSHRTLACVSLCVLSLGSPHETLADGIDNDGGFWAMVLAQGSLESLNPSLDRVIYWFDNQFRMTEDSGGFHQSLVRPALGYALTDYLDGHFGYAWIHTDPDGRDAFDEHRIWQQILISGNVGPVGLASRTRLEQRFFEHDSETGWRFREFVKLAYPMPFEPRLGIAAYEEIFFDVNETERSGAAGFDQNRLFAGLSWKFDAEWNTKLEVGYLNQFIRNRVDEDKMNHILNVNMFFNF